MEIGVRGAIKLILEGRAYLFSLFHTVFGAEPTADMFQAITGPYSLQAIRLFDSEESPAAAHLVEVLESCRDMDEKKLSQLKGEYMHLFIGPEKLISGPWESVYTSRERALFQESTLAVRNWYRRYNYLPTGYPRVDDDHISIMMHFLELTTREAAKHLEDGEPVPSREILKGQQEFMKNHLLNWIDKYVLDMQKSARKDFYPAFTSAAAEYLHYDYNVVGELMKSIEL